MTDPDRWALRIIPLRAFAEAKEAWDAASRPDKKGGSQEAREHLRGQRIVQDVIAIGMEEAASDREVMLRLAEEAKERE